MSSTASRISLRTGAGTVFTPSRFISSSRQRTLSVASNMRWMVPFVRRRADLRDHPGQVALPGGGVEEGESAWSAAQREVAEEIGVPVGRLVPLGAGDPIYAAVSNFSVVPFVAYLPDPVPTFVHDERELEGVLEIPLDRLLDDSAWLQSGDPWRFRYLAHEESMVWGLTERIFAGLAPKLSAALSEDQIPDPPAAEP